MTENTENAPLGVELVAWRWQRPHLQGDALWVMAATLDVADVGVALTRDDVTAVRICWRTALYKPDKEQLDPGRRILCNRCPC